MIFLFKLLAGEDDLGAIYDDNVIAGVDVGGERRLVLTSQNARHIAGKAAENHIGGVYDVPLSLHVLRLGHICLHYETSV